jgi:hypothetical protein
VAGFLGQVEGAEGGGNVLGELGAGGGVNGLGGRKAFEVPESVERVDKFLWIGQDGDEVGLEAGAGSLPGLELAVENEGGIGKFLWRETEVALKKISAGLRPVRAMRPMPFWR